MTCCEITAELKEVGRNTHEECNCGKAHDGPESDRKPLVEPCFVLTVPGSSETEFIESGHRRPTADVEVSSAARLAASRRRLRPVGRRVVVEPEELPDGEFVFAE